MVGEEEREGVEPSKKSTLTQDLLSEYFCWIVLNFGCNEPVIITE